MRKRLVKIVIIVLSVIVIGKIAVSIISTLHIGIPCAFFQITGLKCPGCGNTRAIISLYNGNIAMAMKYNFLIFAELLYIIWFVSCIAVNYIKSGKYSAYVKPGYVHVIMLIIVLIWGIVRNIIDK